MLNITGLSKRQIYIFTNYFEENKTYEQIGYELGLCRERVGQILRKILRAKKTRTGGNIIVEEIKIGDIHYEYDMGLYIKCEVLTKPHLWKGNYYWKSKNLKTKEIVDYAVSPEYSHYAPKLYNYEAYRNSEQV